MEMERVPKLTLAHSTSITLLTEYRPSTTTAGQVWARPVWSATPVIAVKADHEGEGIGRGWETVGSLRLKIRHELHTALQWLLKNYWKIQLLKNFFYRPTPVKGQTTVITISISWIHIYLQTVNWKNMVEIKMAIEVVVAIPKVRVIFSKPSMQMYLDQIKRPQIWSKQDFTFKVNLAIVQILYACSHMAQLTSVIVRRAKLEWNY